MERISTAEQLFTELYKHFKPSDVQCICDLLARSHEAAIDDLVSDWLCLPRSGSIGVPPVVEQFEKRMRRQRRILRYAKL